MPKDVGCHCHFRKRCFAKKNVNKVRLFTLHLTEPYVVMSLLLDKHGVGRVLGCVPYIPKPTRSSSLAIIIIMALRHVG